MQEITASIYRKWYNPMRYINGKIKQVRLIACPICGLKYSEGLCTCLD